MKKIVGDIIILNCHTYMEGNNMCVGRVTLVLDDGSARVSMMYNQGNCGPSCRRISPGCVESSKILHRGSVEHRIKVKEERR